VFQLFHNPNIDFMGKRRLWVAVSLTLIVISLVILGTKGIHRGIEFEGGAEVQLRYTAPSDVAAVREALAKACGAGLTAPPSELGLSLKYSPEGAVQLIHKHAEPHQCAVLTPLPNYAAAVAYSGPACVTKLLSYPTVPPAIR